MPPSPYPSRLKRSAWALWRFLRQAARFVWSGDGGLAQTGLGHGLRRSWGLVWQFAALMTLVGGIGFAATEDGLLHILAVVVGTLGVVTGVEGLVMYAAIAGTRPPPEHNEPPEAHAVDGVLQPFLPGVWTAVEPCVQGGVAVGQRMSVLDTGQGLLLVGLIAPTDALKAALSELGVVRWVWVSTPASLAHLDASCEAFPEAQRFTTPVFAARAHGFAWDGVISAGVPTPWPAQAVRTERFAGHPTFDDVAFLHVASHTLVVCDLIENLGQSEPPEAWVTRLWLKLYGRWRTPSMRSDLKMQVTDPHAMAQSAAVVEGWAPEAIIMAHGAPVTREATRVWKAAFAFLDGV